MWLNLEYLANQNWTADTAVPNRKEKGIAVIDEVHTRCIYVTATGETELHLEIQRALLKDGTRNKPQRNGANSSAHAITRKIR